VGKGSQYPSGKLLKTLPASDTKTLSGDVAHALRSPHLPVLVVISGNEMGVRKPVDRSVVIGRDPGCDLVLADALVSNRHALIEDRGDGWALVDLGSTNGTSVNARKGTEFALSRNDKLVFGRTVVRFEIQDPLEQAYDEVLERLLNIDDLSGLLVRRKFDADLASAIAAAGAAQETLGLLMMDLDGVKVINDTHGHRFGAYAIAESGRLIGRVLEGRGFASRFGGDEYVAALPGLEMKETDAVGEEILRAVCDHVYEKDGVRIRPGISIGVAAFPESATDPEQLFQRADEALYRAKRGGKCRVSR
jgi:two-component system cell cycle response regulator